MAKELKFEDKEIDGKNVRVIRQGLRGRIKTKAIVIGIAGPAIARAAIPILNSGNKDGEKSKDKFDIKNVDFQNMDFEKVLIPAIDGLAETLSEDKLLKLIDTLMVGVSVDQVDVSDPDKFDIVFDDCMGTMYKVCAFAMKVNFQDLMKDLSTLIGSQSQEKESTEPASSGN